MFAGLVRGATRVCLLLTEGARVDPVQEFADVLVRQFLDRGAFPHSSHLWTVEKYSFLVPLATVFASR